MSEDDLSTRTGNDPSGISTGDSRRDTETAGGIATGDGSNTVGSYASRTQQGKWIGLVLSLATVVYLIAQLVGIVTGNTDKVEKLNDEINQRAQQRGAEAQQLRDQVNGLGEDIRNIPSPQPAIPQPITIAPGKNGKATTTVIFPTPASTPRSTPPTPTLTPTPTPKPCSIPVGRSCILP